MPPLPPPSVPIPTLTPVVALSTVLVPLLRVMDAAFPCTFTTPSVRARLLAISPSPSPSPSPSSGLGVFELTDWSADMPAPGAGAGASLGLGAFGHSDHDGGGGGGVLREEEFDDVIEEF